MTTAVSSSTSSSPPSSVMVDDSTTTSGLPLMPAVSAPLPSLPATTTSTVPNGSTYSSNPIPQPSTPVTPSLNSNSTTSPTPPATPRAHLIQSAVHFLLDPKVQNAPWTKRLAFLESKGLTSEEIQLALEKTNLTSTHSNGSSSSSSSVSSSTSPISIPTTSLSPTPPPPPPSLPPPSLPSHYGMPMAHVTQSHPFRNTLLTLVATAGVCYSAITLAQKYIVPNLPTSITQFLGSLSSDATSSSKNEDTHMDSKLNEPLVDPVLLQLQSLNDLQSRLLHQMNLCTLSNETMQQVLREIQFELKSFKGALPLSLGPPKLPAWQTSTTNTSSSMTPTSSTTLSKFLSSDASMGHPKQDLLENVGSHEKSSESIREE